MISLYESARFLGRQNLCVNFPRQNSENSGDINLIICNYNASGYQQSVSNAASGAVIWQANSMDAFGHLTGERFGNGVTTTHVYDKDN